MTTDLRPISLCCCTSWVHFHLRAIFSAWTLSNSLSICSNKDQSLLWSWGGRLPSRSSPSKPSWPLAPSFGDRERRIDSLFGLIFMFPVGCLLMFSRPSFKKTTETATLQSTGQANSCAVFCSDGVNIHVRDRSSIDRGWVSWGILKSSRVGWGTYFTTLGSFFLSFLLSFHFRLFKYLSFYISLAYPSKTDNGFICFVMKFNSDCQILMEQLQIMIVEWASICLANTSFRLLTLYSMECSSLKCLYSHVWLCIKDKIIINNHVWLVNLVQYQLNIS